MYAVRDSKIAGKGLFATSGIPAGTLIVPYEGYILTFHEALQLTDRPYADNAMYDNTRLIWYNPMNLPFHFNFYGLERFNYVIDGARDIAKRRRYSDASYVNHSCMPNTEYRYSADKKSIGVTALRFISAGEEITVSYNLSGGVKIPCNCRSVLCRGNINEQ